MSLITLYIITHIGYKVETLSSQGKKPFGISLSHSENSSFNLAAADQVDFTRWFMALETSSKSDRITQEPPPLKQEEKEEPNTIKDIPKVCLYTSVYYSKVYFKSILHMYMCVLTYWDKVHLQ